MIDSRLKSTKSNYKKTVKSFIVEQNTEAQEGWRDPHTGLRLAPGAVQNWPDKDDEKYIKYLYANGCPMSSQSVSH
jgi:hypothetical protein